MKQMRTMLLVSAFGLFAAPAAWGQTASERAAKRLADILDPAGKSGSILSSPKVRMGPAKIERPEPNLPLATAEPPAVPSPDKKAPRPRLSPEPSPLAVNVGDPVAPPSAPLQTGPLAKQLGTDVQPPIPLPILGAYLRDRASVADPSMEISAMSLVRDQKPERVNPVSFAPWNLPDPFETSLAIRLRELWPEQPTPPPFLLAPTAR